MFLKDCIYSFKNSLRTINFNRIVFSTKFSLPAPKKNKLWYNFREQAKWVENETRKGVPFGVEKRFCLTENIKKRKMVDKIIFLETNPSEKSLSGKNPKRVHIVSKIR